MRKALKDLGLPAGVLAVLEGSPAHPPAFPGERTTDTLDVRIVPGGPSSSEILNHRDKELQQDLVSLLEEKNRVEQDVKATLVNSAGFSTLQLQINSTISSLAAITGSGGVIDFFVPGAGWVGSSTATYEPLWGQATLPYTSNPQSQLRLPGTGAVRPGTVVRFTDMPQSTLDSSWMQTFRWNDTDGQSYHAIDGRLDTAWSTPVDSSRDLVVSITLPPTLGANSQSNSIGIIPWPLYGTDIVEVWVRNGTTSSSVPGWEQVSLQGQLGYNSTTYVIEAAGACRLFLPSSPLQEVLIRLRPRTSNSLIGLVNCDVWAIEFQPSATVVLDASYVGITSIARIILAGKDPSALAQLPVTINASQVEIDLSTPSINTTPVLTSVGFREPACGQESTGFDIDVFSA